MYPALYTTYLAYLLWAVLDLSLALSVVYFTIEGLLRPLFYQGFVARNMLSFGTFTDPALVLMGFLAGNEVVIDKIVFVHEEQIYSLNEQIYTSLIEVGLWK